MEIPKIIHQIWLQGEGEIPDKFKNNIDTIKKMHQSWKYILWDDIQIISLLRKKTKLIDTYYRLIYLHQKVDFARYVILYYHGGIYIDMDVQLIKSFEQLLNSYKNYDLVVSEINCNEFEGLIVCRKPKCINNGIIFSKPKIDIIKMIIKHIIKNPECKPYFNKQICIQETTGPALFSNIIYENLNNRIKILPPEYLEPCVFNICNTTANTVALHKHNISWCSKRMKNFLLFYIQNKLLLIILCCIGLLIFGYRIYVFINKRPISN